MTATDLDFGTYTAQGGSPLQGTTLLQTTCTPNTTYNVGLNAGTSPGATVNQRRMVSGSQVLNYPLYSDTPRSKIWGETIGTDTVTGVGTGQAQDYTSARFPPPRLSRVWRHHHGASITEETACATIMRSGRAAAHVSRSSSLYASQR